MLSAKALEAAIKRGIEKAAEKKTRVKINDGDNLMLIVRPAGGASWVLEYRIAGKRKNFTLGAWPTVGLKLARELAERARVQVATGVDPVLERAKARTAAGRLAVGYTVRDLVDDWQASMRVSEVYRGNIEAAMRKDVLPRIGSMAPEDVTRQDIIAILREMEARGALEMLRRVRMWLAQAWEAGLDAGKVQGSPVPTGHLKSFMPPARGHFPAITDIGEIPALMRAIRAYESPVVRAALELSAYTFQRPTEVREATWDEFDLVASKWVIPAARMKTGREHWVPLAPQVVQLLVRHRGLVGGQGWLFPGWRRGKPLSEAALGHALEALGYKGRHSPHGFRAMARTVLEEHLRVDPKFAERQLAHVEADKVKRAYNRAEFWADRVRMMELWAKWLGAQK